MLPNASANSNVPQPMPWQNAPSTPVSRPLLQSIRLISVARGILDLIPILRKQHPTSPFAEAHCILHPALPFPPHTTWSRPAVAKRPADRSFVLRASDISTRALPCTQDDHPPEPLALHLRPVPCLAELDNEADSWDNQHLQISLRRPRNHDCGGTATPRTADTSSTGLANVVRCAASSGRVLRVDQ